MRQWLDKALDRLRPARWRTTPQLARNERHVLWKQVAPADPCLRAVVDLLGEVMETNANVSMDLKQPAEIRLQGAEAAGVARGLLYAVEDEWTTAREELQKETINQPNK